MGRSRVEFPRLAQASLQVVETQGNGNCLFHALSDQLYGDQTHHREIRIRVTEYMRENASRYKAFLAVNTGGGTRRNPKRKNAGTYASSVMQNAPTDEEINATFEAHLEQMARGGTYGDNLEVNAFTNAYNVHVKIWRPDEESPFLTTTDYNTNNNLILHIALHAYEHYSSVRNASGPHSGKPNVNDPDVLADLSSIRARTASATPSISLEPWQIETVKKSLPWPADSHIVREALMKTNGDVDDAVSHLMEYGSTPSSPGSSSIERDQDEEDELEFLGQRKKQDRRQSRATKSKMDQLLDQSVETLSHRPKPKEHMSTNNEDEEYEEPTRTRSRVRNIVDDTDSEPDDEDDQKESSASDSSAPPRSLAPRLKLTQPRQVIQVMASYKSTANTSTPRSSSTSRVRGHQTRPRQGGAKPQVSASVAKDMKKRAQKAASKERKQGLMMNGNSMTNVKPEFIAGQSPPTLATLLI